LRVGRNLQNLLLLACGVVLGGVILELGTLLILGEQPKFPRHVVGSRFGLRINQPGSVYRHKSADVEVWFRINAQGMRVNHDYAYEKEEGVTRIVSLGDSYTIGYEVAEEDTFASILERELRAKGYRAEVLNAGVSGYSTAEECLYLERELLKYRPDLILVSFYGNDLFDNIRTGLFVLRDGQLRLEKSRYVPLGRLGDFLNTNPLLGFLSERSNAFALLKEDLTVLLKWGWVRANLKSQETTQQGSGFDSGGAYERKLTAAIFERIYHDARRGGIPLVIQSIPFIQPRPPAMRDVFPDREFSVDREGLRLLRAEEVLRPFLGKERLVWERSHGHWTPFSNRKSGMALADLILREKLLEKP